MDKMHHFDHKTSDHNFEKYIVPLKLHIRSTTDYNQIFTPNLCLICVLNFHWCKRDKSLKVIFFMIKKYIPARIIIKIIIKYKAKIRCKN